MLASKLVRLIGELSCGIDDFPMYRKRSALYTGRLRYRKIELPRHRSDSELLRSSGPMVSRGTVSVCLDGFLSERLDCMVDCSVGRSVISEA